MAEEREDIILDFQIEQGDAIASLERTKKSIIELKKEQQDLTKAYKNGNITIEEYASESVRLEGILKKQQNTYNTTQKSVTGVKTKMDELIDSNKKLSKGLEDSTKNIRVAGVSVGDLSGKLASFANPATAAVAIVGALGAAYARSSIGAKDLGFVSAQLSSIVSILTDKFALLFSSAENGEGAFTKLLNGFLKGIQYIPIVALYSRILGIDLEEVTEQSRLAALAQDELNQIHERSFLINAKVSERLAENAELMTDLGDVTLSTAKKEEAAFRIQLNLDKNREERVAIIDEEIAAIRRKNAGIQDEGVFIAEINRLLAERSKIESDATRQSERVQKQLNSLLNAELKAREAINREVEKFIDMVLKKIDEPYRKEREEIAKTQEAREMSTKFLMDSGNIELQIFDSFNRRILSGVEQSEDFKREQYRESARIKRQIDDESLAAQSMYLQAASELSATFFGEGSEAYKTFALSQNAIDTFRAATAALAPPPTGLGPVLGPALAALTIAQGLSNAVRIAGIGAAAGGGDFVTTKPTLLLVGDNPGNRERVTVEPLSGRGQTKIDKRSGMIQMGGGGSLTYDGGMVKNAATMETNNAIMTANALKNMPAPVVGVKEITRVQKRVSVKEKVSSL
jgi:hypothetical protein